MASIMAEHGTAPALRAAEAQLNADVNVLVNTSYVAPEQAGIVLPVLKTISGICGTSAAWTHVTLVSLALTGG
jgi:hypothetical protein